jgi:hypothetical protein
MEAAGLHRAKIGWCPPEKKGGRYATLVAAQFLFPADKVQ